MTVQPWRNRIVGYTEEPPDQLLANPKNWRSHPGSQAEALRGVLGDVGIVQNVIVNRQSGFLVDGHLRVMEALKAGQPTVPVTWVDLSDDEEALVLATLDPLSAMAGTDPAQLDDLLRGISTDNPAVAAMLDALATAAGVVPGVEELTEDAPVAVDETQPTRCQLGDVWRVGPHLVACCDSTDRAMVQRLVAERKVGMVWADPPYGIKAASSYADGTVHKGMLARRSKHADIAGDDSTETARRSSALYLELYNEAVHIWWGANHYADALPPSSCWIVWDKENPGAQFADGELAWCNEDLAIRIFKHQWMGLQKDSERGERRVHPTQKPIALAVWAFEKYGDPGDLILDPFLGSGPSLKAAHQLGDGRTVVAFELSPHYVDHILDWAEQQGLTVERVSDS